MQPYFFPYLGYFDLIHQADKWVVFDLAQFARRGWVTRNRILHPHTGWQYFGVPVKKTPQKTAIAELQIFNEADWKDRILNQVDHYRKTAPYFDDVCRLLNACFEPKFSDILKLNIAALKCVCERIGIRFDYVLASELRIEAPQQGNPAAWVFQACEALGADEYTNLPGGKAIYDKKQFQNRGIKLTFRNLSPMQYDCPGYEFEPNLSIVDVLMWNRPDAVRAHLNQHQSRVFKSAKKDDL